MCARGKVLSLSSPHIPGEGEPLLVPFFHRAEHRQPSLTVMLSALARKSELVAAGKKSKGASAATTTAAAASARTSGRGSGSAARILGHGGHSLSRGFRKPNPMSRKRISIDNSGDPPYLRWSWGIAR